MTSADSGPSTGDKTDRSKVVSPESTQQTGALRYDAFISYSRRNSEVADKLERDPEKYPLPKDIRKRLDRRHLSIFRDISDLTGNQLKSGLEQKLQQSRTLVVLCSPAARRSQYVGLEIDRFARLRGPAHIVPTMVAGGPNNDPTADAADWAFPDALGQVLGSEPLATDLRQAWKVEGRKAKLARGSPWVQLVADIVGMTTDELTDRIAKAERRRLQSAVGILAVVLAIVSVLGGVAVIQRSEARTQRAEALYQRDQADARFRQATSLRLVAETQPMLAGTSSGGPVRAYQQLAAARRLAQTPDDGPLVDALIQAVNLIKIFDAGSPVDSVAFSPDGTRLATAGWDQTVRLWDPGTGQPIGAPLTGHTGAVRSVAFSPDGTRLATASHDKTVRLWDPGTGQPIGAPLTGHTGAVRSVAFSPDGTRLATGGDDETVRLWDPGTGQQIGAPLTGHTRPVRSVAFSPDGHRLASASDDNTVRLWPVFPDAASALCAKLTTNMSHQQWRDWVSPDIDYMDVCPGLPIPADS